MRSGLLMALVFLLAIVGMLVLNKMEFNDQVSQHEFHCKAVKLWLDDAKYGVPAEQRSGWPDYNNSCEVSK